MIYRIKIDDELLAEAKVWLRVGSSATDAEVRQTVQASLLDLQKAGVSVSNLTDDLIKQAIKEYCKAFYGYNKDSAKHEANYNRLRDSLASCDDYRSI